MMIFFPIKNVFLSDKQSVSMSIILPSFCGDRNNQAQLNTAAEQVHVHV